MSLTVSCRLSATGVRFSVIRFPPRDWALLTVGLPTQRVGPRRGYRVPHTRATTGLGAFYTPRTTVLIPDGRRLRPASAAPPRPVLSTPLQHPSRGALLHEASTKVQAIHPSGLPLARHRPDGTSSSFGFPPSFAPRRPRAGQRTSGQGQAIEHGPETTLYDIYRTSNVACLLNVCDPTSHRRLQGSRRDGQILVGTYAADLDVAGAPTLAWTRTARACA
jgi:hypothetical protein